MSSEPPVKLRIPRQEGQDFELFQLSVEAARNWTQALPVTSSRQVAQQLCEAISDLNHVELAPHLRFMIMDELRPALLVASASLSRRFLNQPLVMPEEPRQLAQLAQDLHRLAGTAYTIAAVHAIQHKDTVREIKPARLVCESIHRAIRFAGARLLQTFQLYRPVELHGWLELHQLYALAEGQRLSGLHVSDDLSGSGTITTAYLQAAILGCSKPNQMRQGDLAAIYRGLREWTALLEVASTDDGESLFLVDLDSDRPPLYSQLYREPPGPRTRYIDTEPLVQHLQKLADAEEKKGVVFDEDTIVSPSLLRHLTEAYGKMSMRNFTRKPAGKSMCVAIGLSACHYYMAGEKLFEQVLHGEDYIPPPLERVAVNPFLDQSKRGDLWQRANPEEDFISTSHASGEDPMAYAIEVDPETRAAFMGLDEPELPASERYPVHSVTMFDASPGGYCLEWTADLPGSIKTGDLVCVREGEDSSWAIAAIRWMSRLEEQQTLIGLELLSPAAEPYGAYMQQKKAEDSVPMRVLVLPEIKLVGQPQTILTPRAGFRERQKIVLSRHGEERFIQLVRQLAVTGAFSQFEFRYIKQLGEVLAEDKSRPRDTAFDSLWTNI